MEVFSEKTVTVGGWVRTVRDSMAVGFLELNDGSYLKTIQIVKGLPKVEMQNK